jgi:hypothetical protein
MVTLDEPVTLAASLGGSLVRSQYRPLKEPRGLFFALTANLPALRAADF